MTSIAVTGLSGVIGEVLLEKISQGVEIIDLYHNKKFKSKKIAKHIKLDLLDRKSIPKVLESIKPNFIIHLAAITHIDECEKDRVNGNKGKVWKVNVEATEEIAKICARRKIFLIFLSTECVFNGKRKFFKESAKKNPINWYGKTKSEAEDRIIVSGSPFAVIRSVVAYHKNDNEKTLYGKMLRNLKSNKLLYAVDDQLFTPTYTYDIVKGINKILTGKLNGIYHISPEKSLSPYHFACLIAKSNGFSIESIKKTTLDSYYKPDRSSLRLKNSSLDGSKTNKTLEFIPSSPKEILL